MQIGFSTSSFARLVKFTIREAIAFCRELDCPVIELSASYPGRLPWLAEVTRNDIKEFSFVSVHAPAPNVMDGLSHEEREEILAVFEKAFQVLKFDQVVIHPGAWLGDYSILKKYTFPVSIENMDIRNTVGITVASMRELLIKGNFKMTLDLNHCYTHDDTMRLAHDFYGAFKDKISHFHLSDYGGLAKLHTSFFQDRHDIILRNIPSADVPIILEEFFTVKEEAKQELDYLRKFLTFNI